MVWKRRTIVASLVLGLACLAAYGQAAKKDSNIRVTIEVGRMEAGKKGAVSSYVFITPPDGTGIELQFGSRVPIPTKTLGTAPDEAGKPIPISSFSYQNVGMMTKVRTWGLDAHTIKIEGSVEGSLIRSTTVAGEAGTPPTLGTLTQNLNMLLKPGTPLRASTIDEPGSGSVYLEIKADYLD